jgi:hypothetical protein
VFAALALLLSPAFAFETCTPKNNYLERLLPKAATQASSELPRECVAAAHVGFAAKGVYGFCPTAKGRIKRDRVRPCDSENYVGAVYKAIADVTECLDVSPRLIFGTLNLESGAHVNAVGPAGDAGIGQLTRPAIEEVNRRAFADAKDDVKKSNSAACRAIMPHMVPLSADVKNRCAFITVPDNPTRALIYSVLMIKQNHKTIDVYWNRLKPKVAAGLDIEHLKQHLTMLSYNAGPAGSVAVAAAYAKQMGARLTDRDLNFRNQDARALVPFIAKHFPVKKSQLKWRKRIAGYVPALIAALGRTEARAKRSCTEPDTFPSVAASFLASAAETAADPDEGADHEVEENMKALAETFTPEVRSFTCADTQAEFLAKFLPAGATAADLPEYLRPAYDGLCGK